MAQIAKSCDLIMWCRVEIPQNNFMTQSTSMLCFCSLLAKMKLKSKSWF